MNVVFFINITDKGEGGHYYSLLETATQISRYKNVTIFSIGKKSSPVLERFDGRYIHVYNKNTFGTFKNTFQLVRKESPSILHAFDVRSFFYAKLISIVDKVPIVLTRCGGPNPRFYPYADETIVYSIENYKFLKKIYKYKEVNFSLIPNRVQTPPQDQLKINKLIEKLNVNAAMPIFLRISRISSSYKESILQSIKLIQLLNKRNVPAQLLIVGYIQEEDVFNELVKYKSDFIHFVTEPEFTVNASSLIDIADFVVGTGRSFMEAALLGKKMLVPTSNREIPTLIDYQNVDDAFKMNFSPRYRTKVSEESAFSSILEALDLQSNEKESNLMDYAIDNFSADYIYEKHLPIYNRAKPAKLKILDFITQVILMIRPRHRLKNLLTKK